MTAGQSAVTALFRMPAALRHRDFALLWTGQSVSMVGDGVFTVALALETLRIDRSPAALSFVSATTGSNLFCAARGARVSTRERLGHATSRSLEWLMRGCSSGAAIQASDRDSPLPIGACRLRG